MPSFKHEVLKNAVNLMSLPMMWGLPPTNHLRAILETFTIFSTLPWGVHREKLDLGEFTAEFITPDAGVRDKVILFLHGGGYVIGSPHTHRGLAGKITKLSGIPTLLIDYRKAPEFPFPNALKDAFYAYQYLWKERKYKPKDIFLIGDSAGGGLAVALQLKLKDEALSLPAASILLSPYVDLVNHDDDRQKNKNDRFLDVFEMRKWATLYAPNQELNMPYISPLFGDLSGLPPMLIQASESEVLFHDAQRLVKKAQSQGVEVTFQTWEGLIHWWHMFRGMPEARDATQKIIDFLLHCIK